MNMCDRDSAWSRLAATYRDAGCRCDPTIHRRRRITPQEGHKTAKRGLVVVRSGTASVAPYRGCMQAFLEQIGKTES